MSTSMVTERKISAKDEMAVAHPIQFPSMAFPQMSMPQMSMPSLPFPQMPHVSLPTALYPYYDDLDRFTSNHPYWTLACCGFALRASHHLMVRRIISFFRFNKKTIQR